MCSPGPVAEYTVPRSGASGRVGGTFCATCAALVSSPPHAEWGRKRDYGSVCHFLCRPVRAVTRVRVVCTCHACSAPRLSSPEAWQSCLARLSRVSAARELDRKPAPDRSLPAPGECQLPALPLCLRKPTGKSRRPRPPMPHTCRLTTPGGRLPMAVCGECPADLLS
jgi:hypothetical protein